MDYRERFWAKVAVVDGDACWLWTARCFPKGYGQFAINSRPALAHRIAWELTHGAVPAGLVVMHTCDNPPCCNPAHLRPGTQSQNIVDSVTKGRHRTCRQGGEHNASVKLTDQQVDEIRELRGVRSQRLIASEFGISQQHVSELQAGKVRAVPTAKELVP